MKNLIFYKFPIVLLFLLKAITTNAQTNEVKFIDQKIDSIYAHKNDSFFAFKTVDEIIKKSNEIGYKSGVGAATQLKGYLYLDYGNFDFAKKYLFEAYELNITLNNDKVLAKNLRLIGIYYERKDDYANALEYFYQSLQLRVKIKDEKGIAECNSSIGIIYHYTMQLQKALIYYRKALTFYLAENNEKSINDIYSNIGAAYNNLGNMDSSIFYLKLVIKNKTQAKDYLGLGRAYHNLAITFSLQGKYDYALNNFNLAIKNSGGGNKNGNNGTSFQLAGGVLIKLKKFEEAKKYLSISESIFKVNNMQEELAETYIKQAEVFEKLGDFKKSISYIALSNQLKDSITQNKAQLSFNEIETKYKTLEKSKEIELLKAENNTLEQASRYNSILVLGLIILLFVSTALVFYLKKVKHTKRQLINKSKVIESRKNEAIVQNNNLEKLIEENQSLMGILAHDLRSPFGKILGLINLLEDKNNNEEEKTLYVNYINEICNDSLNLIQETIDMSQIYHEKLNESVLKIEVFLPSEIIENTVHGFIALAMEKSIELKYIDKINQITILNSKDYLTRILDNILSNAIKFSPKNTVVIIEANRVFDNIIISIKDNGPGLTDIDKQQLFMRFKKLSAKPTGKETSSGLGLFIVKQLVDLIDGTIQVNSELGKGAEFILTIPIKTNKLV